MEVARVDDKVLKACSIPMAAERPAANGSYHGRK